MKSMKTTNMNRTIWLVALAVAATASTAFAAAPGITQSRGRVTSNGTNFSGTGQFKFAIVETNMFNDFVWSNDGSGDGGFEPNTAVPVQVTDGLFIVGLGDNTLTNMGTIHPFTFSYEHLVL